MSFLRVTEIIIGALFLILILTQILIPAYKGRRWWPLFRKKEKEWEDKVVDAAEKKAEVDLAEKVKDIREQAKRTAYQRQRERDKKWTP